MVGGNCVCVCVCVHEWGWDSLFAVVKLFCKDQLLWYYSLHRKKLITLMSADMVEYKEELFR